MAHGFKESDFQHGVFIPYLTAPSPAGLDWILGKPADIDQARWLVPADLLQFLREDCPLNASSFAKAVRPDRCRAWSQKDSARLCRGGRSGAARGS
jgi:type I restriction enzyme R subunit